LTRSCWTWRRGRTSKRRSSRKSWAMCSARFGNAGYIALASEGELHEDRAFRMPDIRDKESTPLLGGIETN